MGELFYQVDELIPLLAELMSVRKKTFILKSKISQLEMAGEEETRLREAKERERQERRVALAKIYPAPYRVSGRMRMLKN